MVVQTFYFIISYQKHFSLKCCVANVILNILVAKLAKEMIAPRVKKMDDQHKFDPDIVQALFDNGVSIGLTNQSFSNIL